MSVCVYDFSVDCRSFDASNIIDICKYLMKKCNMKYRFFNLKKKKRKKKMLIRLLTGLVNGSNHTKCVSLSNEKCMTQP